MDINELLHIGGYVGTFVGGGLGGAIAENIIKGKQKQNESLFDKRFSVYTQLLASIRYTTKDDLDFRVRVDAMINEVFLLTKEPRTKDLLTRIRAEIHKGSYWSKKGSKIGRSELRELEELLQKELGVSVPRYKKLLFWLSGKAYKGLRKNDVCPCYSGKKYSLCHGIKKYKQQPEA